MADLSKVKLTSGEECDIKDAVAREALGDLYPILADSVAIPSDADLNTYTGPGVFYATPAIAATLSNSSITSSGFKLFVIKRVKGSAHIWQIEIGSYDCVIALRYYSGTSWSSWKRLTPS